MIAVAVAGAAGRMGEAVCEAVQGAQDMHLAELHWHFGGLSPALSMVWEHVLDAYLTQVGECCTPEA